MANWQFIIIISFLIPVVTLPFFIRFIKKYKMGQRIRQEGPDLHQHKTGTPTMGGILMFGALGLIIGPIVAALFVTIWEIYGVMFQDVLPPGRPRELLEPTETEPEPE